MLFLAFENNSDKMDKTNLESMQIVAKQKRMAAEQAELEALEAENDVEAIEFEIAVVKRKGFIEETFWRFPHIAEQIFEELDSNTLSKCLEMNKWWKKILRERKICQINQLEKHTYIKKIILKKALGNMDFETVHNLANYSMKVHKKVIIDGMNSNGISYEGNDCRKQQEEILRYLFEKKHRDKIQFLLTELMLKNTMHKNFAEIEPLIKNGDFALIQMFLGTLKKKKNHDFFMEMCEKVHLRWSNGSYSGENASEAFFELYPLLKKQQEINNRRGTKGIPMSELHMYRDLN